MPREASEGCQRRRGLVVSLALAMASIVAPRAHAQNDAIAASNPVADLTPPAIVEITPDDAHAFNYPYLLVLPEAFDPGTPTRLLVETNNTGTSTDNFEVHRQSARRLAESGPARTVADALGTPLLVPIFPRPSTNWHIYTHALDRDSMLIEDGDLARLDLQLIAMIDHARALLEAAGTPVDDRIFMQGFSASGTFANRFAALHPDRVRAVAVGGVNALPILPLAEIDGVSLPYPIGIADVEQLTGHAFDMGAYRTVAQLTYMGSFDRNDTYPYDDAWNDDERAIIARALGERMQPDRWERVQAILAPLDLPIQCVTYNSVAHAIRPEMEGDIAAFFKANAADEPTLIEPHQFPLVPYREIIDAHVDAIYWNGDERLPEHHRTLNEGTAFAIGISDWLDDQDHQQLSTFLHNAGFDFEIKGDGHTLITISRANINGLRTGGDTFRVFEVRLDAGDLARLEPGHPYHLVPLNPSDTYRWHIDDAVTLTRPH